MTLQSFWTALATICAAFLPDILRGALKGGTRKTGDFESISTVPNTGYYVPPDEYLAGDTDKTRQLVARVLSAWTMKSKGFVCLYSTLACGKLMLALHSLSKDLYPVYVVRNVRPNSVELTLRDLVDKCGKQLTVLIRFDGVQERSLAEKYCAKLDHIVASLSDNGVMLRVVVLMTINETLELQGCYKILPLSSESCQSFLKAYCNHCEVDIYDKIVSQYKDDLGRIVENYSLGNPAGIVRFIDAFGNRRFGNLDATAKYLRACVMGVVQDESEYIRVLSIFHFVLVLCEMSRKTELPQSRELSVGLLRNRKSRFVNLEPFLSKIWGVSDARDPLLSCFDRFARHVFGEQCDITRFDLAQSPFGMSSAGIDWYIATCGKCGFANFRAVWEKSIHDFMNQGELVEYHRIYIETVIFVAIRAYLTEALPDDVDVGAIYDLIDILQGFKVADCDEELFNQQRKHIASEIIEYLDKHARTLETTQILAICQQDLDSQVATTITWVKRYIDLIAYFEYANGNVIEWGIPLLRVARQMLRVLSDEGSYNAHDCCDLFFVVADYFVKKLSQSNDAVVFEYEGMDEICHAFQNVLDKCVSIGLTGACAHVVKERDDVLSFGKRAAELIDCMKFAQLESKKSKFLSFSREYDLLKNDIKTIADDLVDRICGESGPMSPVVFLSARVLSDVIAQSGLNGADAVYDAARNAKLRIDSCLPTSVGFNMKDVFYRLSRRKVFQLLSAKWGENLEPEALVSAYQTMKTGVDVECGAFGVDAEDTARFFADTVEWFGFLVQASGASEERKFDEVMRSSWADIGKDIANNWVRFTWREKCKLLSVCCVHIDRFEVQLQSKIQKMFLAVLHEIEAATLTKARLDEWTLCAFICSLQSPRILGCDEYVERVRTVANNFCFAGRLSPLWREKWMVSVLLNVRGLFPNDSLRSAIMIALGECRLTKSFGAKSPTMIADDELLREFLVLNVDIQQLGFRICFERVAICLLKDFHAMLALLNEEADVRLFIESWSKALLHFLLPYAEVYMAGSTISMEFIAPLSLVIVEFSTLMEEVLSESEVADMVGRLTETEEHIMSWLQKNSMFFPVPKEVDYMVVVEKGLDGMRKDKLSSRPVGLMGLVGTLISLEGMETQIDDQILLSGRKKVLSFARDVYEALSISQQAASNRMMDVVLADYVLCKRTYLRQYPEDKNWIANFVDQEERMRCDDAVVARLALAFSSNND